MSFGSDSELINLFIEARSDSQLVVIEGLHALKHALRFKAEITAAITSNKPKAVKSIGVLAPDVKNQFELLLQEVSDDLFNKLSPYPPRTGVIAIAKRPKYPVSQLRRTGQLVFLEDPKELRNIGMVVRVAAAAGVIGVVTSGEVDPWHPTCIRTAAGLHFALPVIRSNNPLKTFGKPIVVLDPAGDSILKIPPINNSLLVFGTERGGVSLKTKQLADQLISLPMRENVSSLNLATSVAATLYVAKTSDI